METATLRKRWGAEVSFKGYKLERVKYISEILRKAKRWEAVEYKNVHNDGSVKLLNVIYRNTGGESQASFKIISGNIDKVIK